jgi:HEAT repeat protein
MKWSWVFLALVLGGPAFGQQNFVNANVQTHSTARGLARTFKELADEQTQPAWIAYSVPAVEGVQICCNTYTNRNVPTILQQRPCNLEGSNQSMNFEVNTEGEGSSESVLVLYRVEAKKVGKIRTFSGDCMLDAGGLTVHWLADVKPSDSIKLLGTFVPDNDDTFREERKKSEGAISAIAVHRDPEADRVLEGFSDPKQPEYVRRNASFWLGNTRGKRGYAILRKVVRDDPSEKVREQAVFALSLSKVPEAVKAMIDIASKDQSPKVRANAVFWLSQKAGKQAADAITAAIQNDPETKVKKKAVFALSQLPKDEGIPKLIEIARKNANPEVRKEAMFWLGQSKDDRALAFFEDVLLRKQ